MAKRLIEIIEAHCERCKWVSNALSVEAAVDALIDHHVYKHAPIRRQDVLVIDEQEARPHA